MASSNVEFLTSMLIKAADVKKSDRVINEET
jgi:hypothetical protein